LDVNGTLAQDGRLTLGVVPCLRQLKQHVAIHMLTADTHGQQAHIDSQLDLKAHIITEGADEKAAFVKTLGAQSVVAMGNGANDAGMCKIAGLGIAVLGPEGLATALLHETDVLVRDIVVGLDLLLNPNRLRATLRA